jgi:hypothetical protein
LVQVYADGHRHGAVVVAADGTITLDHPATVVEAGLPFEWAVVPMPFAMDLSAGTSVDKIKRVVAVSVHLMDTVELQINGRPVPFRRLGDALLDQAPQPYSGTVRQTLLGYDRSGVMRLHGTGPATILGFTREVST